MSPSMTTLPDAQDKDNEETDKATGPSVPSRCKKGQLFSPTPPDPDQTMCKLPGSPIHGKSTRPTSAISVHDEDHDSSEEATVHRIADELMQEAKIEYPKCPQMETNNFFDKEVKLNREDKDLVSHEVQGLVRHLITNLKELSAWTWNSFNSGSAFDGTKVR